eukprot:scaffold7.g3432.t1
MTAVRLPTEREEGSAEWEDAETGHQKTAEARQISCDGGGDAWLARAWRRALSAEAMVGFLLGASLILFALMPEGHGALRALSPWAPREPPRHLVQPWPRQVLPPEAVAQGLGPLGSGARLADLAAKLTAGKPVTVVVLGGSVSYGMGASCWYFAGGDGREEGLFSYPSTEADFGTLSAYYDVPSLSMRAAVHPLIRAGVPGFKVDKLAGFDPSRAPCFRETAPPEAKADYLYGDCVHPSDTGHQAMADLLIAVVQRAAAAEAVAALGGRGAPELAAAAAVLASGAGRQRAAARGRPGGAVQPLPPPLQSGVVDAPTSLCLMQKWGWTATEPGAWAELLIDTRESSSADGGGKAGSGKKGSGGGHATTVHLGHLKSYQHMGRARVECVAGCRCQPSTLEGAWERKATLQAQHSFQATQAGACRLRVTVLPGSGGTHKVQLTSVMVSPMPITNNAPEDMQGGLVGGR